MKKWFVMTVVVLAATVQCSAASGEEPGPELAAGAKAPGFTLVNAIDGKTVTMKPNDEKLKVVVFTCNQCPYAKAFEPRLLELSNKWAYRGIDFYLVDSNDETKYPEETLENMKARAVAREYPFPYLKDGDSSVARAYGARVTPHVFFVDGHGTILYRGYIDDSAKPSERKTEGLVNALTAITNGREVGEKETRAFGCSIKFKG